MPCSLMSWGGFRAGECCLTWESGAPWGITLSPRASLIGPTNFAWLSLFYCPVFPFFSAFFIFCCPYFLFFFLLFYPLSFSLIFAFFFPVFPLPLSLLISTWRLGLAFSFVYGYSWLVTSLSFQPWLFMIHSWFTLTVANPWRLPRPALWELCTITQWSC